MESEIIKQTFKLGNSAGVLLPKEWKDKKVKIQLIEKSITDDILEILKEKDLLIHVIGIYLSGSYARGEESSSSDVDILIITDNIDKQLKIREYEIVFVSREKFEKNIKKSLYLASLVNESKTILNNDFINNYKKAIIRISIKKNLEEIKSITRINETSIDIDQQLKQNISDETIYSIILRLRELYLIDCIADNKKCSNHEFIGKIKEITGSIEPYNAYLRIKNNKHSKKVITVEDSRKLIDFIKKSIKKLEDGKKR